MKVWNKMYDHLFTALMALIFWAVGMPLWSVIALAIMALPGLINLVLDVRECRK